MTNDEAFKHWVATKENEAFDYGIKYTCEKILNKCMERTDFLQIHDVEGMEYEDYVSIENLKEAISETLKENNLT